MDKVETRGRKRSKTWYTTQELANRREAQEYNLFKIFNGWRLLPPPRAK